MLMFTKYLDVRDYDAKHLELVLDHDQRRRLRARVTASDGTMVALALPRGTVLQDGNQLATEQGHRAIIRAASEHVCVVVAEVPFKLTKIAYHLGNRHTSVQFGSGCLYFLHDSALALLCEALGGLVTEQWRCFDPETLTSSAHHHTDESEQACG
jgi:urease accessory protein